MPASFAQTYRAFAYNNAWANHRLLTACECCDRHDKETSVPELVSGFRAR